jgi:hypothetical protein
LQEFLVHAPPVKWSHSRWGGRAKRRRVAGIKNKPESWKDVFFDDTFDLPGS